MKTSFSFFKQNAVWLSIVVIFVAATATIAFTQKKEKDLVKVKIVKIADGDTTVIEKVLDENSADDFIKQFQNIKGKNVQLMITLENLNETKKRSNSDSRMRFNFSWDSTMSDTWAKCFILSDSSFKRFSWNDSIWKSFPKHFDFDFDDEEFIKDFNFDFHINSEDDGNTIIIKSGKNKAIVIEGDEDNLTISKSENEAGGEKTKTRTKTMTIKDAKGKEKKKVIVTTTVKVIDLEKNDDDDIYKSGKRKSKGGDNFVFYPNPSDGSFILELELSGENSADVKITDMQGKIIFQETINGSGTVSRDINLGSDRKGIFIITVKKEKKTVVKKIIVE